VRDMKSAVSSPGVGSREINGMDSGVIGWRESAWDMV